LLKQPVTFHLQFEDKKEEALTLTINMLYV